jgi:hypothetical protein
MIDFSFEKRKNFPFNPIIAKPYSNDDKAKHILQLRSL